MKIRKRNKRKDKYKNLWPDVSMIYLPYNLYYDLSAPVYDAPMGALRCGTLVDVPGIRLVGVID
jgi:hypothetical protein